MIAFKFVLSLFVPYHILMNIQVQSTNYNLPCWTAFFQLECTIHTIYFMNRLSFEGYL